MIKRSLAAATPIRFAALLVVFALVSFSGAAARKAQHEESLVKPGVISTQLGSIDFAAGEQPFPLELTATDRLGELGEQYFFVQCGPGPGDRSEVMAAIRQAGGAVVDDLGRGTVVARLNQPAMTAIRMLSGLVHVEPYHPALKLHPAIGRAPLGDPAQGNSFVYRLDVMLWKGEDGQAVAAALTEIGATVLHVWGDQLRVESDRALLVEIARLEPVRMIYEALPVRPLAEETTTTVQTGQYNSGATPYHDLGIDGGGGDYGLCDNGFEVCQLGNEPGDCTDGTPSGGCHVEQVLMILDTGIQLDAAGLSDTRVTAGTPGPDHRKVRLYEATNQFGGLGDLLGCDQSGQGGVTHGHAVAEVALGNATVVPPSYGDGFFAVDSWGNQWKLDGVAPGALLVAYDGQYTPAGAGCADPAQDTISPGDLYNSGMPAQSSLGAGYAEGARIVNFSWGSGANVYDSNTADIDTFMLENPDALVFVAAGDSGKDIDPPGGDGIPDSLTIGSPATTKNGLAIGASLNADAIDSPNSRAAFSSVGPAVDLNSVNRIAPQLMAPGSEPEGGGSLGMRSEFVCRSNDNDQNDPVECDVVRSLAGTSFSSAAAAGAALLVRDYFLQGYYPDRTADVANIVPTVSGALVKAILAASAEFMTGENLTRAHRWNNEQGYGRIQLDNVLPVENWPASPTGLIVHDASGGTVNVTNLSLPGMISDGGSSSVDFAICNDEKELRIVLAWTDRVDFGGDLRNNLDLEVTSPSGKVYRGNYFSDDNDRDGTQTPFPPEDCPGIGESLPNAAIDEGPWSLPTCVNSGVPGLDNTAQDFDTTNPIEAIFLSPDPDGNGSVEDGTCDPLSSNVAGTDGLGSCGNDLDCAADPVNPLPSDVCDGGTQQPEVGIWTVQVNAGFPFTMTTQDFSLVIAGGACLGSAVQWDRSVYTCASEARIVVTESDDFTDSGCNLSKGCSEALISDRTTVRVYDDQDLLVDCEGTDCVVPSQGPLFTRPSANALVFESAAITLTDGTLATPGNGSIDVQGGYRVEVTYADSVARTGTATVDCGLAIGSGVVQIRQFGQDTETFVQGGCERAVPRHERCVDSFCATSGGPCAQDVDCPRQPAGFFEYGYPDSYMDAGELIQLRYAFNSAESVDLHDVQAELKCVAIDQDSPASCRPSGAGCEPAECGGECDPRRENNALCSEMTILDSPQRLGALPAGAVTSANFSIQMAPENTFGDATPTVELVLSVTDPGAGKTAAGVAVSRHRLNVDEAAQYFNTDFPTGGLDVAVFDLNNNERQDDPLNDPAGVTGLDYRFETRSYNDLTSGLDEAGSPVFSNQNLLSPWNFDGNDGGFRSGVASVTDTQTVVDLIHNTGEDMNFNGIEDGQCLVDPGIACYRFPTDPRCPGPGTCVSIENHAVDGQFTAIHHNQRGGCGWQTRPVHVCTLDSSRGCLVDADCEGTCQNVENSILSTFEPCSGVCPDVQECSEFTPNALALCQVDADCGEAVPMPGDCVNVAQDCMEFAGTCDLGSAASTGGVLHTGRIGDHGGGPCDGGPGSPCEDYRVISSTSNELLWWSLWLTPVIEKVDQSLDPDGRPNSRAEILQWAWNQSLNLADRHAAMSWEFDTDVGAIFPVDLVADGVALNIVAGPYGAVAAAGDPRQTRGFSLFAPMATCADSGGACQVDADCPSGVCTGNPSIECHHDVDCSSQGAGTCLGGDSCQQSDTSVNGSGPLQPNRVGQNGCFFEGPGVIPADARDDLGLAAPPDDDLDNDSNALVDEFVTDAGPIRNMDITAAGGPDMRLDVLEDYYGETGNRFQGAIGLLNLEGTPANPAGSSYGLAVDDVFVEWREIRLSTDETSCEAAGACAVLDVPATYIYEGATDVTITLIDETPYNHACAGGARAGEICYPGVLDCPAGNCVEAGNDCDLNDRFFDVVDDNDCNDDGLPDLVVLAVSEATGDREIVALNRMPLLESLYRGAVTTSLVADSPGVLYLAQNGAMAPAVDITYRDLNDGQNRPCLNSPIEERQGLIQATAYAFLTSCRLSVAATGITDNGDGDLFADTDETVTLDFTVRNHCGIDLTDCTAQLSTASDLIECISKPQAFVGDIPGGGDEVASADGFRFKVDSMADRTLHGLTELDPFEAWFSVSFSCREFDTIEVPQQFALPIDLNVSDLGQPPITWLETFEGGTLGRFTAENLDQGIPGGSDAEGLLNGDGWRCQYSDPDWINSTAYGSDIAADCYPGANLDQANAVFWQIDGSSVGSPDGGRAKSGTHSLYYGEYLMSAGGFTTPMGVVESVATGPINLGVVDPALSFWHQISLADHRLLDDLDPLRSADRAVVQIQLVDGLGFPVSDWFSVEPAQNGYDEQAEHRLFNCTFDPVDDGNTEDDFFDPADPFRKLGPSSTCFPAFSFGHLGDTDGPFDTTDVGNATTRPDSSDQGDLGSGTWVESVVDLSRFRGQRARLRFLVSAAKGTQENWEQQLEINPDARDDGWWIDEVEIDQTLSSPAELSNDDFTLGTCSISGEPCVGQCEFALNDCTLDAECGPGESCVAPCPAGQQCLPVPEDCGPTCSAVTTNVLVEPGGVFNPSTVDVVAPSWPVSFNAAADDPDAGAVPSEADACHNGTLQFRFCFSIDPDSDCDDPTDELLRGWTENGFIPLAPRVSGDYVVEARCSSAPLCRAGRRIRIGVDCPAEDDNLLSLVQIRAVDENTLSWFGDPLDIDVWSSIALTSSSQLAGDEFTAYPGEFTSFLSATSISMAVSPAPGEFHCFLAKKRQEIHTVEGAFFCNSKTWRSGGAGEIPEGDGAFLGQPQSPIGRDRRLKNALWALPAPGPKTSRAAVEGAEKEQGRRTLGRR